jgi:NAD(P)-dependent dehydrogenase (short-subunit alcohol dehydrogenase family)
VNGTLAIPTIAPYVASKGGINQLTRAMAVALADRNIRVNAVAPGSIMTDILRSVMADRAARYRILSRTPLGRFGTPEEVASVVLFLAGPESSYMTGEIVHLDGGRMALNYTVPVKD